MGAAETSGMAVSDLDRQDIGKALTRIPAFAAVNAVELGVSRLGGLTNRNFRLDTPRERFVLRIPGAGTSDYINRRHEAHAARLAAKAGVNAGVVFFDEADGVMLCKYIDASVTLNGELFKDLGSVRRSALALRRMHECGEMFLNRFELFQMIDDYLAVLGRKKAPLPEGYHDVKREAEAVRRALGVRSLPLRPCHCDPLAENFLDTGDRVYIIDWEYSGNNDPMWDLGDLSVEAAFTREQDEALLTAYFNGSPPDADRGRMVLYKAMCDLLWTLWGIIQHVNQNPADDFWAYALNRFERCKALMGDKDFGRQLQAVIDG